MATARQPIGVPSKSRPPDNGEGEAARPKVSVVVWADEDPPVLGVCMRALATQSMPPDRYEAFFVDAVHATDWQPIFDEFMRNEGVGRNFRFARIEKGGRAKANNYGVRNTTGEIIIFLSDDFVASPDLVKAHFDFHQRHPEAEAVGIGGGFFSDEVRNDEFSRWLEDSGELFGVSFTKSPEKMSPDFFYSANSSIKREFFNRAGLFQEAFPFPAWDDHEMGLRLTALGMQSRYVPAARATHDHSVGLAERRIQMEQAGISASVFDAVHGPHPLQAQCAVHPLRYRFQAFQSRLRYWLTRADPHRVEYYRSILMADFVQAYRTRTMRAASAQSQ